MHGRVQLQKNSEAHFSADLCVATDRGFERSANIPLTTAGMAPLDGTDESVKLFNVLRSLVSEENNQPRELMVTLSKIEDNFGLSTPGPEEVKIQMHGTLLDDLYKIVRNDSIVLVVEMRSTITESMAVNGFHFEEQKFAMMPRRFCSHDSIVFEDNLTGALRMDIIRQYLNDGKRYNFSVDFSIFMSANMNETRGITHVENSKRHLPSPHEILHFMESLLRENFQTDILIIASNGSQHPCHKLFLTGNSSVFEAMFGSENFKEAENQSVEISDMSEEGVKAFLKYLYYLDVSAPMEDFGIAMELLNASEKYGIGRLKISMQKLLLWKRNIWNECEKALQLFCFLHKTEDCDELKIEAVKVIKSSKQELMDSDNYKKMFTENPLAAMDLCNAVM